MEIDMDMAALEVLQEELGRPLDLPVDYIPRIGIRNFTCNDCGCQVTVEFRPGMATGYIAFARRMLREKRCTKCLKAAHDN